MKLTLAFCTALVAASLAAHAADVTAPGAAAKPAGKVAAPVVPAPAPAPVVIVETNVFKEPGKTFTNGVDMVLLAVPGGFWAGEHLVTQKEYSKVMDANPSQFAGDSRPVDSISYEDALAFCKKMTAMDIEKKKLKEGYRYELPTEHEWEALVADAELDTAVTSQNASRSGTSPVGSMASNALGLFDIRGNLWEFCSGDDSKAYRVLRGASWQDHIEVNLRPEFRWYCKPDEKLNTFGFRVLLRKTGA